MYLFSGWLWDHLHGDMVQSLSRRVALITGLDTTYQEELSRAEPFQVVNYGLAGQYEPHVDYYEVSYTSRVEPFQVVNYGLAGQYEPYVDYYEVSYTSRVEPYQVVNYGLAGQYEPHVDYYEVNCKTYLWPIREYFYCYIVCYLKQKIFKSQSSLVFF